MKKCSANIVHMGKRYVSFFCRNPDYYRFLFGRQNIIAHLKIDEKTDDDYPPFVLLKILTSSI